MPTPKYDVPLYTDGQVAPQGTLSEQMILLTALLAGEALTWQQNTPPGSPADGNLHLVGPSPTGAWNGKAGKIAVYASGWYFYPVERGTSLYRVDAAAPQNEGRWVYGGATDGWYPTFRWWTTVEHWTGRYIGEAGAIATNPAKVWRKCIDIAAFPAPGSNPVTTSYGGSLVIDRNYPIAYELVAADPSANTLPVPAPLVGLNLDIVFYSTGFDLTLLAGDLSAYRGTLCLEYVKDV